MHTSDTASQGRLIDGLNWSVKLFIERRVQYWHILKAPDLLHQICWLLKSHTYHPDLHTEKDGSLTTFLNSHTFA